MKKSLLLIICLISSFAALAQSAKEKAAYIEKAEQLKTEVWGNPVAEFKSTTAPANFSKESAVILARSFSLSRASSGKLKFGRAIGVTTRTTKFSIFHERVKINDKTALESFSTLAYQKRLDKTTSQLFARFANVNNTFIGAKVLKPGGKELIVNTSEEVLTKNEAKDQKGKLAIPDLQVGDILDYYICKQDIADKEEGNLYKDNDNLFFLVDEYPVLYYSIEYQFNKKIKFKTIYANGAPHFEETRNSEGDQILSLKLTNIPKYQSQVWISGFRQYPYIEIGSAYDDPIDKVVEKNKFEGKTAMLQAQKYNFEKNFIEREHLFMDLVVSVKENFKDKKSLKAASADSVAKVLYTKWKFNTFCQYIPTDLEDLSGMKYRAAASRVNTTNISFALTEMKVDHDVLLVASRNGNFLDNVFNAEDFEALIRINGSTPAYLCFDDIVTHYNEIPARFQGEKVIVLHPKRKNDHEYDFTESEAILPVIAADQNYINEQLNVSLSGPDQKKLAIERIVKEKGALRHDDQKDLMLADEIDIAMTDAAAGIPIEKRYKRFEGMKKFPAQVNETFAKEHSSRDKYYSDEIKTKFSQEPQKVTDCKIINTAVNNSRPIFEYSEKFELDNLVKKAGNNFIIDVGKLTGGFLKIEEKDKVRDKDVYMPMARSFKYTITIDIPKGYAAKGMEELTGTKANKTGSFTSSATVSGDKLHVSVNRVYTNNFEKASDWPNLVAVINTAAEFDSKKILFEKVN
ncbi:DUF3857 domain-containing protein [Mucilaginibacter xinganensis]|uniref:DUF3857 domain-containing protein n=1 Tax=Mucilaginibacter xinganensis TaxID=1234841 RepID=A0A223NXI2_9SPHI|nr:DUF3857 domain-containing protein [Mucilaginibacter xinganensis]ASU34298.1 hypothetical protein MuYL_2411 [Mucilaginibacter xinganensis]